MKTSTTDEKVGVRSTVSFCRTEIFVIHRITYDDLAYKAPDKNDRVISVPANPLIPDAVEILKPVNRSSKPSKSATPPDTQRNQKEIKKSLSVAKKYQFFTVRRAYLLDMEHLLTHLYICEMQFPSEYADPINH